MWEGYGQATAHPHPGQSGRLWKQQGDLSTAPTHARQPGIVAPAQQQVLVLNRYDDGLPPALFKALLGNHEMADPDVVPARRPVRRFALRNDEGGRSPLGGRAVIARWPLLRR